MDRDEFFYEMAFREVESGEIDKATWSKAFALSTDSEHAKKLYIQYRVDQIKNAPEANAPDENDSDPESSEENILTPTKETPAESKEISWLVYLILGVPVVRVVATWVVNNDKSYPFDLLEILTPQLQDGGSWFTLLWPFALAYWLVKRTKTKTITSETHQQFINRGNSGIRAGLILGDYKGVIWFFVVAMLFAWFSEV